MISPLAYVDPSAQIGQNVEIGPFCFIDKNVVIGDNNIIMPHVNIMYGSRIGNGNQIHPGAVIGGIPQDLKFRGEDTTAEIGDNNRIRENVTINRGTASKGKTVVGSNCILGNSTKIAGEVVIDDFAILSACVLVHQFCHIGGHVMIQGGSGCSKDIPPYVIGGRHPVIYAGLNIVGLRRRGFTNETIEAIHNAYRIIYQNGLNVSQAIAALKEDPISQTPEVQYIINFVETSERGIITTK